MSETDKLRDQILSQNPTDEQKEAIFADEREFLLRAAPGSGKTWTSCRRFIWRGANWEHNVGGLALLSFTNAAIREFHEATIKVGRRELLSDPNYVGTFDSFVERFIITPFGHLFGGITKRPKLFVAPRPGDRNNSKLKVWPEGSEGRNIPVYAWEIIPFLKERKASFQTKAGKLLSITNTNPVHELFRLGFYTHEQRVYLACCIVKRRPHIAKSISRRFPEIIVDEAQDTNIWLLVLLNLLRKEGTKITLVGDPDQCIYEFAMANAASLSEFKDKWGILEKPLSKSFRCNDPIAESVRNISGNASFVGCGSSQAEYRGPFVIREPDSRFSYSISTFEGLLKKANIVESRSAILCRAHSQLESIRGEVNYTDLKELTKEMAQAAFLRDARKDFRKAHQIVENSLRQMIDEPEFWDNLDEDPGSEESYRVRLALWRFTKSPEGLPSVSNNSTEWIDNLKTKLNELLATIGITNLPALGHKITRKGLKEHQMDIPLFTQKTLFPSIRQETIHQVKGESIDAVLVLASAKFFNAVVKSINSNENTEERRLAYVAMTRARHTLLIGLPSSHYNKHISSWKNWGFTDITKTNVGK